MYSNVEKQDCRLPLPDQATKPNIYVIDVPMSYFRNQYRYSTFIYLVTLRRYTNTLKGL